MLNHGDFVLLCDLSSYYFIFLVVVCDALIHIDVRWQLLHLAFPPVPSTPYSHYRGLWGVWVSMNRPDFRSYLFYLVNAHVFMCRKNKLFKLDHFFAPIQI